MHSQLIIILLVGLAASTYALDLSHANKRSLEDMEPRVLNFLKDLYAQVVYPPLNHVVTNMALLAAQGFAGLSETGIRAPSGRTLHPSDAQARGFFDDLWTKTMRPKIEEALSVGALELAGVLANVGVNGISSIGKRDLNEAEMRGFTDFLTNALSSVFNNVFKDPLHEAIKSTSLMGAQVLAGMGANGIKLDNILGKRDLSEFAGRQEELRGFFDVVGQGLLNSLQSVWTNVIQDPLHEAIKSTSLMGAQVLAGMGANGINLSNIFGGVGKRELTAEGRGPIFDGLFEHATGLVQNQVKPALENLLNGAAMHLAGVLANISQNGIGRR